MQMILPFHIGNTRSLILIYFSVFLPFCFCLVLALKLRSRLHENETVYCVVCDNLTLSILHGLMMVF